MASQNYARLADGTRAWPGDEITMLPEYDFEPPEEGYQGILDVENGPMLGVLYHPNLHRRETNLLRPGTNIAPEPLDLMSYQPQPVPAHQLDWYRLVQRGPFQGVMANRIQKGMQAAYDRNTERKLGTQDFAEQLMTSRRLKVPLQQRTELIISALRQLNSGPGPPPQVMMQPSLH
jgi:hypothetical protein